MFSGTAKLSIVENSAEARSGSIWNNISTPTLAGVTHQLTTEMFHDVTGTKILSVPTGEVFAFEKAMKIVGGGLKKFLNLNDYHIHLFFRNHAHAESVFGGSDIQLRASAGKRKVTVDDFKSIIEAVRPDSITLAAEDVAFDETTGGRRTTRVRGLTSEWSSQVASSGVAGDAKLVFPVQGGSNTEERTFAASLEGAKDLAVGGVDLSAPMPGKKLTSTPEVFAHVRKSVETISKSKHALAPRLFSARGSHLELLQAFISGVDVVFPHDVISSPDSGMIYLVAPLPQAEKLVKISDVRPETSSQLAAKRAKLSSEETSNDEVVTEFAEHGVSCCHIPTYDRVKAHLLSVFPEVDSKEQSDLLVSLVDSSTSPSESNATLVGKATTLLNEIPAYASEFDKPAFAHERVTAWSPVLFSKAYVCHLFRTHEMLGSTLIFLHNWHSIMTFTLGVKAAIETNRLGQLAKWLIEETETQKAAAAEINAEVARLRAAEKAVSAAAKK